MPRKPTEPSLQPLTFSEEAARMIRTVREFRQAPEPPQEERAIVVTAQL